MSVAFRDQSLGVWPLEGHEAPRVHASAPSIDPEASSPTSTDSTSAITVDGGAASRLRVLFDGQFDFVWRSLRRLGVPSATVDDAAQEVFVVAARRLGDILPGRERSFLFATALRIASTARRAGRRRGETAEQPIEDLSDHAPGPDEIADRRRAREVLDRVLESMDLDLRTVFVLHELEEMTMAEIATTLELAPGTVASRLRRARAEFQAIVVRVRGGGA